MIKIVKTDTNSTNKLEIDITAYTQAVIEIVIKNTVEMCFAKFREVIKNDNRV